MSKVDGEVYDYDSINELISGDPRLSTMIDDVNEDGIIVNQSEADELSDINHKDSDEVSKSKVKNAAKRATNRSMKKDI